MNDDRDLLAHLPEPPPPRPDRREMAIDAALRRFDGIEDPPKEQRSAASGPSLRAILGKPQAAAFATVVLVALVSLPVWLSDGERLTRESAEPPATAARNDGPSMPQTALPESRPALVAGGEARDSEPVPPAPQPEQLADSSEPAPAEEPAVLARSPEIQLNRLPAAAAPAPAPPPPGRTDARSESAAQSRAAPAARIAALPSAVVGDDADDRSIVVTGSRTARSDSSSAAFANRERAAKAAAAEAGDWNACTIEDPRRDLRACGELGDLAEPGTAGRANAHLADGLRHAWQGDLARAIDAFDRAIALAPNLSLAYLNRGLAHWREGDTDRALEDLDQAIANDREAARGYYYRSRLYLARGASARADADARRAVRLDPSYEAVLP